MPRNKLIEDLHGLRYDFLTESDPNAKAELEAKLLNYFQQLCEQFNCTAEQLQRLLQGDFRKWCQDEGLQPPPRH